MSNFIILIVMVIGVAACNKNSTGVAVQPTAIAQETTVATDTIIAIETVVVENAVISTGAIEQTESIFEGHYYGGFELSYFEPCGTDPDSSDENEYWLES
jgi:hypothetical protein